VNLDVSPLGQTFKSRWTPTPARFARLVIGLTIFGLGDAFLVQASLGASPWTVFSQGIARRAHISLALSTFLTGLVVLLCWALIRELPGLGTVSNAVIIPVALGIGVRVIPASDHIAVRLAYVTGGLVIVAVGSGLYISAHLGPGPRDGLMTGIHLRTRKPIAVVRLAIEVTVLLVGIALGGTFGVGTICFAFGIGPLVAFFLRRFGWNGATTEEGLIE
jgi:uncharacterized membrane protein YczE